MTLWTNAEIKTGLAFGYYHLHSLKMKLNEELDIVNQWLQLNKLPLNTGKTNFVEILNQLV